MAESSILWETSGVGDGSGTGYTDDQMFQLFRTFTQNANIGGVAPNVLNELEVTGASSPVAVNTGQALVYGIPYFNSASVNVAIPTPAASTRIDRIVLRASWAAQTVRITRIAGTEGAGAPAMTQTAGTTWDVPLAQASITTGGVITVTDERGWVGGVGDGTIVAAMLANNAVTNAAIGDDAVTGAEIADYAIDPRVHISGTNGIVVDPQNGNARGSDAVDLQTVRGAATQVASGNSSTVGGGQSNTASNTYATVSGGNANAASNQQATVSGGSGNAASGNGSAVGGGATNTASATGSTVGGGDNNTASGTYSTVPGGQYGVASRQGQMAFASGRNSVAGDAQFSLFVPRRVTTNATPAELFLDGSGASARMTIPTATTWAFTILVAAKSTTNANESAGYKFEGCIDNNSGTVALVGTVTKTVLGEDVAAWDADVTADNANDALIITVTGQAANTIYWVATVQVAEVKTT